MAYKITDEQNYSDIADAIRGKLGSQDTFLPSEMASAIQSIPSGGGTAEIKTIFIDYEGTVLHEYSVSEINSMSELPALPSHAGLICQGWNWTLSELKSLNRPCVVGAMYITDDGKTRVYISVPDVDKTVKTRVASNESFNATVNWGDGSTSSLSKYSYTAEHTYAQSGDYMVTFEVTNGTIGFTGGTHGAEIIWSGQNGNAGKIGALNFVTKIEIGSNVRLTDYAMAGMINLKTVTIPENIAISGYTFLSDTGLTGVVLPRGQSAPTASLFHNCMNILYVSVAPNITRFYGSFFSACYKLKRTTIPDGVTQIDDYVFQECSELKGIILPGSITTVGRFAFRYCQGLEKDLVIGANLTSMGNNAFSDTNIESLVINSNLTANANVFAFNDELQEVVINGIVSFGDDPFSDCRKLKKITVASGNTVLAGDFVYRCCSLTDVILPETITTIGRNAFATCNTLRDLTLPSSVTSLGDYAFSGSVSIRKLVIPSGVTQIPTYCFRSMTALLELEFLGDITSIAAYAFSGSNGIMIFDFTHCTQVPVLANTNAFSTQSARFKMKVPAALYNDWIAAANWSSLAQYIEAT